MDFIIDECFQQKNAANEATLDDMIQEKNRCAHTCRIIFNGFPIKAIQKVKCWLIIDGALNIEHEIKYHMM